MSKTGGRIFCQPITFVIFYLLEGSPQVQPLLKRSVTRGMDTKKQDRCSILEAAFHMGHDQGLILSEAEMFGR